MCWRDTQPLTLRCAVPRCDCAHASARLPAHHQGLQDVIGLSVTHPTWQRTRPDNDADKHTGWAFVKPGDTPLSSSTGEHP